MLSTSFCDRRSCLRTPSFNLMKSCALIILMFLNFTCSAPSVAKTPPHVVFWLGDDIGWKDVGWKNEKFVTPYMDQLAKDGIILDEYYTHAICTPSRTSLMTGYYAHSVGLQRGVLQNQEPTGLPLRYKTLPAKLKEVGYATHAIGKWHLGFCNESYIPTARGFDSFLGFLTGAEDNYLHCAGNSLAIMKETCLGLDFHLNNVSAPQYTGQFANDVYTKRAVSIIENHDKSRPMFLYISMANMHFPVQAPKRFHDLCTQNTNPARKTYCAAMAAYDESIKNVTEALKANGLYDNTVTIFASDNGGWTMFGGNNFPLRGEKASLWEGGNRVPAFIHSPLLKKSNYVRKGLFHVSDWYPTISGLAGATKECDLDGINQWKALKNGEQSPRDEVVYSIDVQDETLIGAVRVGDYKLITGPPGDSKEIVREEDVTDISLDTLAAGIVFNKFMTAYVNKSDAFPRLYNLKDDPSESHNLAEKMPKKTKILLRQLMSRAQKAKPAWKGIPLDPAGDPAKYGGAYESGWCKAVYDVPTAPKQFSS